MAGRLMLGKPVSQPRCGVPFQTGGAAMELLGGGGPALWELAPRLGPFSPLALVSWGVRTDGVTSWDCGDIKGV